MARVAGVIVRDATDADWPSIWPFFRQVVQAQETYAFEPGMTSEQGSALWMERPPGRFGPIFEEPSTVPSSSTATVVRPGGRSIHRALPCSEVMPGSKA